MQKILIPHCLAVPVGRSNMKTAEIQKGEDLDNFMAELHVRQSVCDEASPKP
jgi:hypothetical protein